MINYDVIEKKGILHELFAGLLADSARIIQENGIDIDSDTPICDTRRKVREIWGSIITDKYSTMEQMKELEDYYKSVKKQMNQYNLSCISEYALDHVGGYAFIEYIPSFII